MNKDNFIQEELIEMGSPLADMPKGLPYSLPDGYFLEFPAKLAESLNEDVFSGISRPEKLYTVPKQYFEGLPAQLLQSAKAASPVKRPVSAPIRFVPAAGMKLAIAATLALMISFGGYLIFSANTSGRPERILASIPGNVISEYMQHTYGVDDNNKSNLNITNLNVDNKDIVSYLNETGWE